MTTKKTKAALSQLLWLYDARKDLEVQAVECLKSRQPIHESLSNSITFVSYEIKHREAALAKKHR